MEKDEYITIAGPSRGQYKEKGSRFLAFAFPVTTIDQVKPLIDSIRKEHHEAKHHCYSYMIGRERLVWRANDDGEPSGTGGKPILGQINSALLTNILIVVSRYFGGTLLGVSGLINAYRSAAAEAIQDAQIVTRIVKEYYTISFPYLAMNDVMKILKDENTGQSEQIFDAGCRMKISFRESARERILARLSRVEELTCCFIEKI